MAEWLAIEKHERQSKCVAGYELRQAFYPARHMVAYAISYHQSSPSIVGKGIVAFQFGG